MSGQREEEGAALLACVRSNATRDSLKLGLMPFEIARPGHEIWVAAQECVRGPKVTHRASDATEGTIWRARPSPCV